MTKSMTALAAVLVLLSGAAQADTVKQIWNEELGDTNPGRVSSAEECIRDSSSNTACYNDRDFEPPEQATTAGTTQQQDGESQQGGTGSLEDTVI